MKYKLTCVFAFLLVVAAGRPVLAQTFGTLKTVSALEAVPANWAALSKNPVAGTQVIEYLGGAPYAATATVLTINTLPAGWVVFSLNAGNGNPDTETEDIGNLTGAPYAATATVLATNTLPAGWVILSLNVGDGNTATQTENIEYVVGADYGSTVTVLDRSTLPTGWIVVHKNVGNGNPDDATEVIEYIVLYSYPVGTEMISAPVNETGFSFTQIFNGATVVIETWNPADLSYVSSPNAPANTIRPGVGYWTDLTASTQLWNFGSLTPSGAFSIDLSTGWNMIGNPRLILASVNSLSVQSSSGTETFATAVAHGIILGTIDTWQAGDTQYETQPLSSASLVPFKGYWIYASEPCALVFPAL